MCKYKHICTLSSARHLCDLLNVNGRRPIETKNASPQLKQWRMQDSTLEMPEEIESLDPNRVTLYAKLHYIITLNEVLYTAFPVDFIIKELDPCTKSEIIGFLIFWTLKVGCHGLLHSLPKMKLSRNINCFLLKRLHATQRAQS